MTSSRGTKVLRARSGINCPIPRPSRVTTNESPRSTASMISRERMRRSRWLISSGCPMRSRYARVLPRATHQRIVAPRNQRQCDQREHRERRRATSRSDQRTEHRRHDSRGEQLTGIRRSSAYRLGFGIYWVATYPLCLVRYRAEIDFQTGRSPRPLRLLPSACVQTMPSASRPGASSDLSVSTCSMASPIAAGSAKP